MDENEDIKIPMVPCANSGAITAYGYHDGYQVLALTFKGGKTYHYREVPPGTFTELIDSKSRGAFVSANIVGKFPTALHVPKAKQ